MHNIKRVTTYKDGKLASDEIVMMFGFDKISIDVLDIPKFIKILSEKALIKINEN